MDIKKPKIKEIALDNKFKKLIYNSFLEIDEGQIMDNKSYENEKYKKFSTLASSNFE